MNRIFSRLGPAARHSIILLGVTGLFWFAWAFGCYQSVYLQSVGFSASNLGVLNAISSAVTIASVSFWGMVSDKFGSIRKVLILVLGVGSTLYALVPLIPTGLPYSPLLFTCFIPALNFFRGSVATFDENLLVRNCNELRLNFGVLRGLGSLLFTVGSIWIAAVLPKVGVPNTFWISGLLMIPAIICVILAREPNSRPRRGKAGKSEKGGMNLGELFKNKAYVSFLFFALIFYIAASCEGNFIPYFMGEIHVSTEQYGIILALRAFMEIPFLLFMVRLRQRFPLRVLVLGAPVLMALECLGFGTFAGSLPGMLLCCTFFGLGNGLFIGSSLNYVYELAPDHLKASAQAFFASVSSVAGILGNLLGGVVFDAIGAKPFYIAVGCAYLVSSLIFLLSFRHKKEKSVAVAN